jgi:hypothetical protein
MSDLLAEFFQVEPLLPRTVNNITGPTLDGNPINLIIFIIIGLFIAGYAYYLWVKGQLKWEKVGRAGVLVLFLFWILLEVVRSFSYLTYFSEDQARFGGKTLSQKRRELEPKGFYSFVEFAEKKVSKTTPVMVRRNVDEYTGMLWNYYTAPLNQTAEADAEYVIGLNVEPIKNAEQFVPNFWVARR